MRSIIPFLIFHREVWKCNYYVFMFFVRLDAFMSSFCHYYLVDKFQSVAYVTFTWHFFFYGGSICLFGSWNFILTYFLFHRFQGKCTTAKAFRGHDPHPHFRRSACSLRSHCWNYPFIPCWPIPGGLSALPFCDYRTVYYAILRELKLYALV